MSEVFPARNTSVNVNARLFLFDKSTNQSFLVDTGADVSVLPACKTGKFMKPSDFKLFAANNSKIDTFGTKVLNLDLGLRRKFTWSFIIAKISKPILGADFLKHYGLLVDIKNKKLVDGMTKLTAPGDLISVPFLRISTISKSLCSPEVYKILKEYRFITQTASLKECPPHDIVHFIETSGPPVFAKPRRLPPEKLAEAKKKFDFLMQQGVCRS